MASADAFAPALGEALKVGRKGGYAPTGLERHELKTLFLRAPFTDWAALSQGHKTEFRAKPKIAHLGAPTPVVLYCVSPQQEIVKQELMILWEHRNERLMDIAESPESLRGEGFETYDQFKSYWRQRTGRVFIAMEEVQVFRLAPWSEPYAAFLGELLLKRLYRGYLPPSPSPA